MAFDPDAQHPVHSPYFSIKHSFLDRSQSEKEGG